MEGTMIIREIGREECYRVLAKKRLARLACSYQNQPYIVPVYLAFNLPSRGAPYLYGFSTPGQKISWMRANPLVCVEVDEIEDSDDWVSVIILGRFEELPETPNGDDKQTKAWEILKAQPEWWEPGSSPHVARDQGEPAETFKSVYYRISIDEMTGHKVSKDPREDVSAATCGEAESQIAARQVSRLVES
jgi:uncharacterized protein